MSETVLEEAQRIIYGDREKTYGHPAKNFENTAMFWRAWLLSKRGVDVTFDVEDVAMMMALLKLARQAHGHKRDNLVDLCGYTACIQKVLDHGAETRNDIPDIGGEASSASVRPIPDEGIESVDRGSGRFLVQRRPGGPLGGMEIPTAAEKAAYACASGSLAEASRLAS